MNVTPAIFAQALLARINMPVTDNNVAALVSFQAHEGGHMHNAAAFNPMNTTMPMPGSHAVTPVGVQAYASWDQGLDATAKTLTNGLYKGILAALQKSAHPDETLKAVATSPWGCTICNNAPASSFQHYRDEVFPGVAPDFFGVARFIPSVPKEVKTLLAVGAVAMGVGLIVSFIAKNRRPSRGAFRVFRGA